MAPTGRKERAVLIATLASGPGPAGWGPVLDALAPLEDLEWLEVRADLLGDIDPRPLADAFPGRLLYTLRSRAEGGAFDGRDERRRARLLAAAGLYDQVDLEAARDLVPELLTAIPADRRLLSWHGPATPLADLQAIFAGMAGVEATLYKLVPAAQAAGEELAPLQLLHALGRQDVVAFASGAGGAWTRFVAPHLGAPVVYCAAGAPGAPGQPSLRTLREDFGLPRLTPVETLFGIAGNPVGHSLSPRIHNAGYQALGLPALYLPFQVEAFGDFWLEVVESGALDALGLPVRGLSVTAPFKEAALAVAGAESPLASRIGAANTLVLNQGVWEAESTDPEGVVLPLRERGLEVAGLRALVMGAGGAGRSAAIGLERAGARVTLANRGPARGQAVARELGLPFLPLAEVDLGGFELVVNATSVGRDGDELPVAALRLSDLRAGTVVIDLVYLEKPTPLLRAAAERGAVAIDGREVLLNQALGQFRMMVGQELPLAVARQRLGLAPLPALPALPAIIARGPA